MRLLVATDLDGCLLDASTYAWGAAREALAALRGAGALLVLASSKTRAEMERLAEALDWAGPLIVENGGALVLAQGRSLPLGVPRARLAEALLEIAAETGARVRGWSALRLGEITALTGLSAGEAALAASREYDEPFVLDDAESERRVELAALQRGLRLTRGGRFHHLTGPSDKGRALRELLTLCAAEGQRFRTVGLGDAPNDLTLLQAVERPILIPGENGAPDAALVAALPDAEIAPAPGPVGWNAAVLAVLRDAPGEA
jgi:mannosyl-3-phosphoglycerate phosphatase